MERILRGLWDFFTGLGPLAAGIIGILSPVIVLIGAITGLSSSEPVVRGLTALVLVTIGVCVLIWLV